MQQYAVDQVGSLTRPDDLKQASTAFRSGHVTRDELRETEDRDHRCALARQKTGRDANLH